MDYSLLLGIGQKRSVKQKMKRKDDNWRYFEDGSHITGRVYSLSLIDYLQQFDMSKYM